jgi:hypothetical protein
MLSLKAALLCISALLASVRASSTPFHLAFPVHDLSLAKEFYGGTLGLSEGRSSKRWQVSSAHVKGLHSNDYKRPITSCVRVLAVFVDVSHAVQLPFFLSKCINAGLLPRRSSDRVPSGCF